jgi:hypothetical protein
LAFAWSLAFASAIAFGPAIVQWWTIGVVIAWSLFVGPFLSGFLPISPAIREQWWRDRLRREWNPFSSPGRWIAWGAGLAVVGATDGCFHVAPSRTGFLALGVFFIAIGLLALVASRLFRHARKTEVPNQSQEPVSWNY